MTVAVVTGADRGIGAALCRQLAARGDQVIAACLEDGAALRDTPRLQVAAGIDVTSAASMRTLQAALGGRSVGLLVCNAGLVIERPLGSFDYDAFQREFAVNALGALRVVEALLSHLKPGSKIGIVTSRVGSLGENHSGGLYGYRISKAAANMAGLNLSHELKPRGVAVMCLHPGSVRTQMTEALVDQNTVGTLMTPEASAAGLIARLDALSIETTGSFHHANGEVLPW